MGWLDLDGGNGHMNSHLQRDLTLKLCHPTISSDSPHYRIPTWPPPDDWPVVIDALGRVVCRVGDPRYDFRPYGNGRLSVTINFVRGSIKGVPINIDPVNARLFRLVINWAMWGDRRRLTAVSIVAYANRIKSIFVLCAREKIAASDLSRFPRVADQLSECVPPSCANAILGMLHELWSVREQLGFSLLDEQAMNRFEAALPDHETKQTPYIPPRIWIYQIGRLRLFLEDFLAHREQLEALFRYTFAAYLENFGSPQALFSNKGNGSRSPFNKNSARLYAACTYHGTFMEVAAEFKVDGLLDRWYRTSDSSNKRKSDQSVRRLTRYFGMAVFVGHKYLLNLSGMRRLEGGSLRADCFQIENDELFGEICTLTGETTKTVRDDDARWVTSKTAQLAVEVMTIIARLRGECTKANPFVTLPADEEAQPYLVSPCSEPWGSGNRNALRGVPNSLAYCKWQKQNPTLFDQAELMLTDEDIRIARLITPSLNPERYAVGKVFHFHEHQLRRTTAVNMCASDLVSDATLQIQLKHWRRAMALYYGQGFSQLRLNRKYTAEHLRTAYEMFRLQVAQLSDSRYVSPFGEEHKTNIIKQLNPTNCDPVSLKNSDRLTRLAKRGEIGARQTLLGLCMKPGPCEFGGVENIIHCSGCDRALGDRQKLPQIKQLRRMIEIHLVDSPIDSPEHDSLQMQLKSAEAFIYVLQQP